jgi:hypothetical protein
MKLAFNDHSTILMLSLQFTHSARYQSRDLGEIMKKDIGIMSMCIDRLTPAII